MIDWQGLITLLIAIIGLIINVIRGWEDLKKFVNNIETKLQAKKEREKGKKYVKMLKTMSTSARESYGLALVSIIFFISVVSSAILGMIVPPTPKDTLILSIYGTIIFVLTSSVTAFLILVKLKSFHLLSYLGLVVSSLLISFRWSLVTGGFYLLTGFPIFLSGIFSAITGFASNYYSVRMFSKKKQIKK